MLAIEILIQLQNVPLDWCVSKPRSANTYQPISLPGHLATRGTIRRNPSSSYLYYIKVSLKHQELPKRVFIMYRQDIRYEYSYQGQATRFCATINYLVTELFLTEYESCTGNYWPEIVAVWSEHGEVRTETTEGRSPSLGACNSHTKSICHGIFTDPF